MKILNVHAKEEKLEGIGKERAGKRDVTGRACMEGEVGEDKDKMDRGGITHRTSRGREMKRRENGRETDTQDFPGTSTARVKDCNDGERGGEGELNSDQYICSVMSGRVNSL